MNSEFCPELQARWEIVHISMRSLNEIKITLVEHHQESSPEILGRHIRDVLTWPTIRREKQRAELTFSDCFYFSARDDLSHQPTINESGEGREFQRLLDSELLRSHNHIPKKLVHFRIIGLDEIIDVLTATAPLIQIKNNIS